MGRKEGKQILLEVLLGCVLAGAAILLGWRAMGEKPFENLAGADVVAAQVELTPPGVVVPLTEADVAELVPLLNRVTVYRRDDSYADYAGQNVRFTLIKRDGTQVTVNACNPFVIIDGTGYRTGYGPCEELSGFANSLLP